MQTRVFAPETHFAFRSVGSAIAVICTVMPLIAKGAPAGPLDSYETARRHMVQAAVVDSGVQNERVIEAMRSTPRHEFVPSRLRDKAYEDMALPIGDKQTISSPFIVAFMTEALDPQPTDRVLEIGTGSGYQAAVLSGLVKDVFTIEIVPTLGKTARSTLERLKYENVHTKIGDGFLGWDEHAPFDKIIVTCSPEDVPRPLVEQLREGGLLVIPVGQRYQQTLYLMRKKEGKLVREALRPTLFVPMTGTAEQSRRVLPDPSNPSISNGSFEDAPLPSGFVPDWYYQRQTTRVADASAPDGDHYLSISNDVAGKPGIAMQGFPVDGRQVIRLKVSAWVKYDSVRMGRSRDELAAIIVTFYDQNRAQLSSYWLGPFYGSAPWHTKSKTVLVPPNAREAILRIGLFGAVGQVSFDHVRLQSFGK